VPPTFSSVTSGSGYDKQEYIGVSLGAINPVREVITEAHSLFGGDSSVASLLSLGAGHPGAISFPSGDGFDLNGVMRNMMSDCEQRAQEIERQVGRVGIYFRFSVEQGLQSHRLGPGLELNQVMAHTDNYLSEHSTKEKLNGFVQNFDTASRLITLDQLGMSPVSPCLCFLLRFHRICWWLEYIHSVGCYPRGDIGCIRRVFPTKFYGMRNNV
jgi:hypothetical protein